MMIQAAIESSSLQPGKSLAATLLALATLLFGATGTFAELRRALNQIWGVELVASGFLQEIRVRLLSFGMVVMVGFLLLVSLIFAACTAALNSVFTGSPSWLQPMLAVIQLASSLVVASLLFAAILKVLPETHLRWAYYSSQIVFVGAELTRAWTLAREGRSNRAPRRVTNEVSWRASRADRKGIISPVPHGGPSPQPSGAGAGGEFN